ncbi:MAG: site-specific integrase [bacterium]|nr:site-specific integrase [bacterium]
MADLESFRRYCEQHYRPGSVKAYVTNAQTLLEFMGAAGMRDFAQLPTNLLIHYDEWMGQVGYTPSTAHAKLAAARSYLRWVRDLCDIPVPEQRKVRQRKVLVQVRQALEPGDFANYFVAANQDTEPMRTATMLLVCSGLRSQELLDLTVDNIHTTKIRLADDTETDVTCFMVENGKGGKSRIVPLLEEGEEVLRQYFDGPWQRLAAPSKTRYLFPSKKYLGHPVRTRALRYAVKRVSERMGLDLSPHALRRTYLTQLHRIGVDFATISKIAGHEDPKTLYKHYLSLTGEDVAAAVHERGGRLDGGKKGT